MTGRVELAAEGLAEHAVAGLTLEEGEEGLPALGAEAVVDLGQGDGQGHAGGVVRG
jgi:hypothetical protein